MDQILSHHNKCWNTRSLTSKQCIEVPYFVVPFQRYQGFPLLQLLRWQCVLQDLLRCQYRFNKPLTSCSPTKRNLGRSGQASEPARQWAHSYVSNERRIHSENATLERTVFLNFFTYFFYNEVRFVFCLSVKYLINTENCVSQNDLLFAHTYFLPSLHLRPCSTETKHRSP